MANETTGTWTVQYLPDDDTGVHYWWVIDPAGEEVEYFSTRGAAEKLRDAYERDERAEADIEYADDDDQDDDQDAHDEEVADLIERITAGLDAENLDGLKAVAMLMGV